MNDTVTVSAFSPKRLGILIRNRLFEDAPAFAIGVGTVFALNLITLYIGSGPFMNLDQSGTSPWFAVLFIGAALYCFKAFTPMHSGRAGTEWILLPATRLEKFLDPVITYIGIYTIAAAISGFGVSALLAGLAELVGKNPGIIWNPITRANYAVLPFLLVFLATSARFRKSVAIKTIGLLAAFSIAFGILLSVGIGLRIRGMPSFQMPMTHHGAFSFNFNFGQVNSDAFSIVFAIFYYCSSVLAGLYAYFLIAEKEAKDEVQ